MQTTKHRQTIIEQDAVRGTASKVFYQDKPSFEQVLDEMLDTKDLQYVSGRGFVSRQELQSGRISKCFAFHFEKYRSKWVQTGEKQLNEDDLPRNVSIRKSFPHWVVRVYEFEPTGILHLEQHHRDFTVLFK